tara:strand:- start:569 stop:985 length:417 start_codon:yes stop_codon:yes gene_type:complete
MKKVLILCTGNSCRSQMAEGWLRFFSNDRIKVYSAGTHPEPVNRYAIKAMSLVGIDISKNISNNIDDFKKIEFDFIITVCDNAKERCPIFSHGEAIKIHRSFSDPALATGTNEEQLNVYIDIRDQLKVFFQDFSNQLL